MGLGAQNGATKPITVEMDRSLPTIPYHARTFNLLKQEPKRSTDHEILLRAIERELQIQLPAAFREWYSYENSINILEEYSNDHPVSVRKLGYPLGYWFPYNPLEGRRIFAIHD
jgi:hypothetical protein